MNSKNLNIKPGLHSAHTLYSASSKLVGTSLSNLKEQAESQIKAGQLIKRELFKQIQLLDAEYAQELQKRMKPIVLKLIVQTMDLERQIWINDERKETLVEAVFAKKDNKYETRLQQYQNLQNKLLNTKEQINPYTIFDELKSLNNKLSNEASSEAVSDSWRSSLIAEGIQTTGRDGIANLASTLGRPDLAVLHTEAFDVASNLSHRAHKQWDKTYQVADGEIKHDSILLFNYDSLTSGTVDEQRRSKLLEQSKEDAWSIGSSYVSGRLTKNLMPKFAGLGAFRQGANAQAGAGLITASLNIAKGTLETFLNPELNTEQKQEIVFKQIKQEGVGVVFAYLTAGLARHLSAKIPEETAKGIVAQVVTNTLGGISEVEITNYVTEGKLATLDQVILRAFQEATTGSVMDYGLVTVGSGDHDEKNNIVPTTINGKTLTEKSLANERQRQILNLENLITTNKVTSRDIEEYKQLTTLAGKENLSEYANSLGLSPETMKLVQEEARKQSTTNTTKIPANTVLASLGNSTDTNKNTISYWKNPWLYFGTKPLAWSNHLADSEILNSLTNGRISTIFKRKSDNPFANPVPISKKVKTEIQNILSQQNPDKNTLFRLLSSLKYEVKDYNPALYIETLGLLSQKLTENEVDGLRFTFSDDEVNSLVGILEHNPQKIPLEYKTQALQLLNHLHHVIDSDNKKVVFERLTKNWKGNEFLRETLVNEVPNEYLNTLIDYSSDAEDAHTLSFILQASSAKLSKEQTIKIINKIAELNVSQFATNLDNTLQDLFAYLYKPDQDPSIKNLAIDAVRKINNYYQADSISRNLNSFLKNPSPEFAKNILEAFTNDNIVGLQNETLVKFAKINKSLAEEVLERVYRDLRESIRTNTEPGSYVLENKAKFLVYKLIDEFPDIPKSKEIAAKLLTDYLSYSDSWVIRSFTKDVLKHIPENKLWNMILESRSNGFSSHAVTNTDLLNALEASIPHLELEQARQVLTLGEDWNARTLLEKLALPLVNRLNELRENIPIELLQVLSESNKELITSVNEQIAKGEKSILNDEVKQYIDLLIKNQAPGLFSEDTREVMKQLLKQNPEEVMKSFASFVRGNNLVHKNNQDFIINAALKYSSLASSKEIIRENILKADFIENEQTRKDLWEAYTETATQKEILQLVSNLAAGSSQMTCYKKHNQKNPKQFVDLVNSSTSALKDLNPNEFSSLLKSISGVLYFSNLENYLKNNEGENNKEMTQSLKVLRECVKNHLFNYIQNNPKDALKTLEITNVIDDCVSLDVSSTHWFEYYLDLNSLSSEKYPVTKSKEFREALSTKIINQFQQSFLAKYSNNPLSFFELKQNERTGKDEWVVPFMNTDLYGFKNTDKFLSKFLLDNLEVIKQKANGIPLNFKYANFSGLDLSQYNLEGINFQNANFTEAILPKDLSKINFQGANLTGTDFSKIDILPTSSDAFQRAVLNKANFSTHDLSNFNFESTHLVGADFSEVKALPRNPNAFKNAYLSEVNFSNCDLSIFNFQNANLYTVDFSKVTALPSSPDAFFGANLQGSDFTDCDLSNLSFKDCKLGGTLFSKVKALPSSPDAFRGVHLKDSSSNLYVDFSNLDLSSYSFAGINFENIDLGNKNFSNTIFPHKLSSYVDLNNEKIDLKVLQGIISAAIDNDNPARYGAYKTIIQGISEESWKASLPAILKTLWSSSSDHTEALLNNLEQTYTHSSEINTENNKEQTTYTPTFINYRKAVETTKGITQDPIISTILEPEKAKRKERLAALGLTLALESDIKGFFRERLIESPQNPSEKVTVLNRLMSNLTILMYATDKQGMLNLISEHFSPRSLIKVAQENYPRSRMILSRYKSFTPENFKSILNILEIKESEKQLIEQNINSFPAIIKRRLNDLDSATKARYEEELQDLLVQIANATNSSEIATPNAQEVKRYMEENVNSVIKNKMSLVFDTAISFISKYGFTEAEIQLIKKMEGNELEKITNALAYIQFSDETAQKKLVLLLKKYLSGASTERLNKNILFDFNNRWKIISKSTNYSNENTWLRMMKSAYPQFNIHNLRKPFFKEYSSISFSVVSDPLEFFTMSKGLETYSCLSIVGSNKSKLAGHVLNTDSILIFIESEGQRVGRVITLITPEGIRVPRIYWYSEAQKSNQIELNLKQFIKDYKEFLGMSSEPLEKDGKYIRAGGSSPDGIPIYYDGGSML